MATSLKRWYCKACSRLQFGEDCDDMICTQCGSCDWSPRTAPSRLEMMDLIILDIRLLETDLDDSSHTCGHCGLNKKDNWSEAQAREQLRAMRSKVEKMKSQEWANAPERNDHDDVEEKSGHGG